MKWSGTGKREVSIITSFPTFSMADSLSMLFTTSLIMSAICFACGSFIPLVVIAGVPILRPLGLNGGAGSFGTVLQFVAIRALSRAFASFLPGTFLFLRSMRMRWLSLPPETRLKPCSSSLSASVLEFLTICLA